MHPNSLRRRLISWLAWPLGLILLLGSGIAYTFALHAAMNAYDLGLLDNALDLSKQIEVQQNKLVINLPLAAQQMLQVNNEDRVAYAAWDDSGHLFSGTPKLLAPEVLPAGENHLFRDIELDGEANREVLLRGKSEGKDFYIAVSQTMRGRNNQINSILAGILLPETLLVLVSLAAILLGVRHGLSPVQLLCEEITRRSPTDLRSIEETTAPAELAPIIHAINDLLEKLGASFASHRRFIADAAHQLRTPLASLSGQIEVGLEKPQADNNELLRQLLATARRTTHLSNQLLSLSRMEHAEQSMCNTATVDLKQVLLDTSADFVTMAARKNVELDFDAQPCQVLGSQLMLRELLANLLDNAVRYTQSGGKVTVRLKMSGSNALLTLEDNGPGVPENELGKLGVPFHRLSSSQPEGCGLGLAIVREIARLHDAEVGFSLSAEGHGLQVRVKFPTHAPAC